MKKYKNYNGITLIALIITIILLIILAGISISTLTNQGLLKNAKKAKEKYQESEINEKITLLKYEMQLDESITLKEKMINEGLIDKKEINEKGISNINNDDNFIVISNYNGLKELSKEVNEGKDYSGKNIYLIDNIDCNADFDSETGKLISGEKFESIGDSNSRIEDEILEGSIKKEFKGNFNGLGYTIKNMYINENSEDELSNLKNELYKITIMLKEESEISRQDKENIKMSVEDISHQLKTPLTSIMIMLDNLKDNPNMDEDTKQKFIFEISKQVDWINWLVISILKLSRLEADVVKFSNNKINVKKFIDEIIGNLEIPIEIKNQKISIEGDEDASFIGDYKWQQEAITNIIKNAIEHNKENGKITIKYEENVLFTKITIIDEGQGIAKEDLKHIFERFYKAQNSSDNSVGIGLSLAKNIIEKNNGMINCKSEIGNGTEFIVKYMK